MRRIFITWELGGGLGHLMQILPLARALAVRGHQIFAALRDIPKAQAIFPEETIKLLQAPFLSQIVHSPIQRPLTFTHILHNIGFEDEEAMAAMCRAWRTLYDLVKPDLVLFDHSPTALLAARGHSFRKVPLGSGFCIPPDEHPLPSLRPWLKTDPETLQRDEDAMLARINRVLERFKQEPLDYISQLYTQVDRTLLLTFSELDHYAQRTAQAYWGVWSEAKGKPPKWPSTSGRHIYAYLKNFEALSDLLALLKKLSHPTIIVSDAIPEDVRKRFASSTLRFETEPLDLKQAGRQCDLAILNAGHGTTAEILLAGRPILLLPIYLEQGILARRVARELGAGLDVSRKDSPRIADALHALLSTDDYAVAAERFADRYANLDPSQRLEQMLSLLETLL